MATVSFWVEKIIEKQPFIQESLCKGLINNAALAESMIPELEEKIKKKVKFSAVNMAIRRLAEKLNAEYKPKAKFDRNTNISIKMDLIGFTIENKKGLSENIKEMYHEICSDKGDFLTSTQGLHEIMIITNASHEKAIKKIYSGFKIKREITGLSGISIDLPKDCVNTPGVYYLITRELAWNNVSIIDLVSTFEELTIIVKDEDATPVFDLLRKLVKSNR